MRTLIKTCALPLVIAGLTACGGDGGGKKTEPSSVQSSSSSSVVTVSSSQPASSVPASSAHSSSSLPEGSERTLAATNYTGYSVAEIEHCGMNISAAEKTFAIFADYDGNTQNQSLSSLSISGWNHTTNGNASEWVNLKNAGSTYNFSTSAKVNEGCNNADTLNMVLVKKIADWDRQHANGFERNILAHGYKFGDIENLVLDVKINSAKTAIPTVAALKSTYSSIGVDDSTIETLESGKVNIGIVIFDGKADTVLSATRIIELDQALFADKWIRVTIPLKDLKFCSTTNYNCTVKTPADLGNTVIAGIQFVAETKSGLVLRNHIKSWSNTTPETFKEMDLSFKKIEFQLK